MPIGTKSSAKVYDKPPARFASGRNVAPRPVDQLVTLLFAKYAREVAKALPSDQAYPLRGSDKRTARAPNGFALG
jgi:hypothetical protein